MVFKQLTDPGEPLLKFILAGHTKLVFPVRRDAVFRCVVHLPCADLHFKRHALLADHRGVQRLIHIRLRRGDIIFEPAGDRAEHIVDDAQAVVAVNHRIDDDAHGIDIIDFIKIVVLHIHLAVDAMHTLDAPVNARAGHHLIHAGLDARFDLLQEFPPRVALKLDGFFDLMVGNRVEIADGEILQLLLDGANAEPMRDGGHRFQAFPAPCRAASARA